MAVIQGATSGNLAEVTANNRMKVDLDTGANPAQVSAIKIFSENDDGTALGTPLLVSPETDRDYRLRISSEALFDCETFNYTAQNTGKHFNRNTTFVPAWSAAGLNSNPTSITANSSGFAFGTYAEFPILGASILYCEIEASFTTALATNTIVDWGLARLGAAVPYAPTDGVYFRVVGGQVYGVINSSTSETVVGPFSFTPSPTVKYQFIITMHERDVEFWIDNVLYGTIGTPNGQSQPCMSSSLPLAVRHAIVGGLAGTAMSFTINDYAISVGGTSITNVASTLGNRMYGSYQGLSGGTMGTLANYANSANPTPSVPVNNAAAANFVGLGGQFWETATYAVNTDVIICSYQVPAGTVNVQGRRLVIRGIGLTSHVTTAIVGGPFVAQYSLAIGSTSVDQNVTETSAAKKGRRIALSNFTQAVTAAQAVSTIISQPGDSFQDFGDAPIFVNPGEFIQVLKKHIGTVATAGVIAHSITFVYGWE